MISKGAALLDLETVMLRKTVGLQPRPLGKGAVVAVVVQNTLLNMDVGTTGNNVMVCIGNDRVQPWLMLPGQESPVLYVRDLEELYGRVQGSAGSTADVDVTLLVYQERKGKR